VAVGVTSQRHSQCVVAAGYVMSPLLVLAYTIAGSIAVDFASEPLGQ